MASQATSGGAPSPQSFFDTATAYQRSAALKAAIEIELFTHIGSGDSGKSAREIAAACGASERGVRIICDYLTIAGFLSKRGDRYALTPDSAQFLDKKSRAYLGASIDFLMSSTLRSAFDDLTTAVRRGTTSLPDHGTVGDDHSVWVNFARAMGALQFGPAQMLADVIVNESPALREKPIKVLDIAAGHGMFGIALAQRLPKARIVSQDFESVVAVGMENAQRFGVADRFEAMSGDAFEIDLGDGRFDLVLLTNFLHHFDQPTCIKVLKKVHRALAPQGRAVTVDFIPDENRTSPPPAAGFSLVMLATTPAGDAYTFKELEAMFRAAGFGESRLYPQPLGPNQAMVSLRGA